MTSTKQYLRQAYRLNEIIDSHVRELEELRLLSTSLPVRDFSHQINQVANLSSDRISSIVGRIIDLENQIKREIDEFLELKQDIHDAIEGVENLDQKLVLRYRYIEFLTWEKIAERLHYSLRQIHRIHSAALENIKIPKK